MSSWRGRARPIIAAAICEAIENGMDLKETKRMINGRYPFGRREMWPYKVWCNEVKRQLEMQSRGTAVYTERKPDTIKPLPGQRELFG